MNRALVVGLVFVVSSMGIAGCGEQSADEIYGEGRLWTVPLDPGPGAIPMGTGAVSSVLGNIETMQGQAVVKDRAGWAIGPWGLANKGGPPLVMAAKLAENQDVQEVNQYLMSVTPWGISGSTWEGNPLGDYDFTEVGLVMLLYLFGEEPTLLYPATVDQIANVLLIDGGGTPRTQVPYSYGLILDTENHHLMTEGSRYLKNQWLFQHGETDPNYDNATNGLEAWLLDYLEVMLVEGVYEFNSIPYLGYTVQALLNLDAFAQSTELSTKARYVLDTINWQYALGSLDLRRCAPFRRQLDYAGQTELYKDPHTTLMLTWTSDPYDPNLPLPPADVHRSSFAFIAEMLPYRLPADVKQWVLDKPEEYFVRFGRGPLASPEIYSGGPGWLLSAGGVYRGPRSIIAARPITLMLSDGVMDLLDCFHMPSQNAGNTSTDWMEWTNTGVHRRFACCNGPVGVPSQYVPGSESGNWRAFAPDPNLLVAVYSQADLGLIILFPDWSGTPSDLMHAIVAANPSDALLSTAFTWPNADTITYDPNAAKGTWVIETVNGQPVDRDYDSWPHVDGGPTGITFDRPGSAPIPGPGLDAPARAGSIPHVAPLPAGSAVGLPIEFTIDESASSLSFSATVPGGPTDSDSSAVIGTIVANLSPLVTRNSIQITDINLELSDGIDLFYVFYPIASVAISGDPQDPFGLLLGVGDGLYGPYGTPGQAVGLDPSGNFNQGENLVELKGTAIIDAAGMLVPLMNPTEDLRGTGPYDLDLIGTVVFTSPNEVRLTLAIDAVGPIIEDPILIEGHVTGTVVANAVIPDITAPVIAEIVSRQVEAGGIYTETPQLTQGHRLPVTWSLVTSPAGMFVNVSTGEIIWPGTGPPDSVHTVTLRAENVLGTYDATWNVTVTAAPVIFSVPDQTIAMDQVYEHTPTLMQGASLAVAWSLVAGPATMTIDPNSGRVRWGSPTPDGNPHTVTLRATNAMGSHEDSWLLTVTVPPRQVTITLSPENAGLKFSVDGWSYLAPLTFTWPLGSSHRVSIDSPQTSRNGTSYLFDAWSDGNTNASRTIVAGAVSSYIARMRSVAVNELTISGPTTVREKATAQYSLWLALSDGSLQDVTRQATWGLSSYKFADIVSGRLRTHDVATDAYLEVYATLEWGNAGRTARLPVTVLDVAKTYTLVVSTSPGTPGQSAPSTFAAGEMVSVAVPDPPGEGMVFAGWAGDAAGAANPLRLTMDGNKTVIAQFVKPDANTGAPGAAPCAGLPVASAVLLTICAGLLRVLVFKAPRR